MIAESIDGFIEAVCRIVNCGSQLLLSHLLLMDDCETIPVEFHASLMWNPEPVS
jgi:hypothetical protein